MKAQSIAVTFPPKEEPLFNRVVKSCPNELRLAEHCRNLLRKALDCTADTAKRRGK